MDADEHTIDGKLDISVLYVEDDRFTREMITEMLKRNVRTLYLAQNGTEGLELFRLNSPDIVLTDIRMPVMDGLEMARQIKEMKRNAQVIVTTAYSDTNYLIDSIDIGVNQYVLKPVNKNKLISAIQRCADVVRLERTIQIQEAAIKEGEERLRALINATPDLICFKDGRGCWMEANESILNLYGITDTDYRGRKSVELTVSGSFHRESLLEFEMGDEAAWSNDGILSRSEETIPLPDGTVKVFDVIKSPIFYEDGRRKGLVVLGRDITERAHLEEQLRQAQKMEAVGQLAGGIAHDFNNILTAIIGYANILIMKMQSDDALSAYVRHILSSSERAATLTQSLLAFSRKQIINPKPVDLNEIVGRIEKLLARIIGEDIDLNIIRHEGALTVMADSGQIEQVLMNLATNARDAMPEGGLLTIETGLAELDSTYAGEHLFFPPGQYALISVSDTGTGIDEKTRENIFEPFFTTKEVGKGTGLGLSIVYGIVKQHNGTINVYSEHGRGTTFKIYLPIIRLEAEDVGVKSSLFPDGGTETILLAEDDPDVRNISREVLEAYGYKVLEARDGQEALDVFVKYGDGIDLVMLDVIMPKKNGREAYEDIRVIRPGVKALFLSGYTADLIHRKGILETGMNFMSKPVTPDELLRKVRSVLDGGDI